MILFSLLKELKKRLRRKRRWLVLGVWLILLGLVAVAGRLVSSSEPMAEDGGTDGRAQSVFSEHAPEDETQAAMLKKIKEDHTRHHVVLQTHYVCGEESQQLGEMDGESILKLHESHPNALIAMSEDGVVSFTEMVNDLSPQCKDNAYFGVDPDGNLTLFNGLPVDERVIKTFFQLNIRYLESSLPRDTVEQLHNGIRVTDMAEFNSVLSTFSDYAVDETEKVMKRQ